MKNVIIRNAGVFTPARALVWRSKLSSVDGFSIGITEFQIPEIPNIGGLDISGVINQFAYASNPVNRTDCDLTHLQILFHLIIFFQIMVFTSILMNENSFTEIIKINKKQ